MLEREVELGVETGNLTKGTVVSGSHGLSVSTIYHPWSFGNLGAFTPSPIAWDDDVKLVGEKTI